VTAGDTSSTPDDRSGDFDFDTNEDAELPGEEFADPSLNGAVEEDAAELLQSHALAVEEGPSLSPADSGIAHRASPPTRGALIDDEVDDAAGLDETAPAAAAEGGETDWSNEMSAKKIGGELRRIEEEIKRILEGRDPRRKRKFSGTRRWLELEEDILSWRYTDRFDEPALARLRCLVARRHHLFRRIRFLAGTRPTWNT